MKKTMICLMAVALVCAINQKIYAQQGEAKTAEERAEAMTKLMDCELKLTKDEMPKVYALNLSAAKKLDSVIVKYKKHQGRINRIGADIKKQRDVSFRHVLTADQYSLFLKIEQQDPEALKQTEACRQQGK